MNAKHKEEAIFKAALKFKSPAERTDYLKKACEGDAQLLARVEALLKAHDEAGDFFDSPILDVNVTLDDDPLTEAVGSVVGPYNPVLAKLVLKANVERI